MKYILALISIILGSLAQYLLKVGMTTVTQKESCLSDTVKNALTSLPLWGGIACYGFSMIFWLYVLSQMELSKAYPIVSLGYIFTLILGYWLLGESLTFHKILGVILIVLGVVFVFKG